MNKIQFIKEEYLKPTPILYLCRGIIETSLSSRNYNTSVNIVKADKQNEVSSLTFEIPFSKDRKITIDDCEKLVKFENDYFVIKEIETDDGSTPIIKVSTEHESTELKGIYCECIDVIGVSPYQMYQAIMNATRHPTNLSNSYKWLGTDVVNKFRHLQKEDETSVYENLVSMCEVFNGWLEITTDESGQNWIFLRTQEIDDGKFIKKNLDMKTLNITTDSKEIFTQVEMFGAQDELTGEEINIMSVNPNANKSYLENYSYYLAKGIPTSNIDNEAKYQQLKVIRDDKYTSPQDLYDMGIEELAKCSIPKIDASLSMSDLSIYLDSPITPPRVGHKLLCIDKDIDFIFTCRIVGVERPYNNPADVKIEISNVNRYNTQYQNINHTVSQVDRVISTNPNGTGDTSPYVPMCNVKDGEHINIIRRVGDVQSLINATYNEIKLRVDDLNNSYSQILMTANSINSTVETYGQSISNIEQLSNSITSTVTALDNGVQTAKSEIIQTADKISVKVSRGEMGSMIEQNPQSVKVSWNQNSRYATLDDTNGLLLGDVSAGTYSKVGYDGRLSLLSAGETNPYHCLVDGGVRSFECTDEDYTRFYINLPNKFAGLDDSEITVISSVRKVYDTNIGSTNNICFWFGCYASCVNGRIQVDVMSKWRTVQYEDDVNGNSWVKDINDESNGMIDISYIVIA